MNITEVPRYALRKILAFLTKKAIKKHNPLIITIVGEKDASLIRELVYIVCSTKYNTHRNLEKTDSEFSIPLTMLGELYYPPNNVGWIVLLTRNLLRLLYLKPHKHAVVIQLHKITKEIQDLWMHILSPNMIIATEKGYKADILLTYDDIKSLKGKKPTKNVLYFLKKIGVTKAQANKALEKTNFLQTRITIIPGKEGTLIVDARHFYYPTSLKTIQEITEGLSGKKFLITDIKTDTKALPKGYFIIDGKNIKLHENAVYIFRCSKKLYTNEIRKLAINAYKI